MPRPRKHIRLTTKLAATLACLLPPEQRDDLRARQVSEEEVLALFQFDHIVLHALGGSDAWHNLDPKLVAPHREKSRRDTSIVAKVKRIRAAAAEAKTPRMRPKRKIPQRPRPWPPRGSRRFPHRMSP